MKQTSKQKIMELYFKESNPMTIRKISSITNIPKSSTQRIIQKLKKDKIITKEGEIIDSNLFRRKKINFYTEKIVKSGLVNYLISELNPSAIILFGSISRGDSIKTSDIDIFIETYIKKELNLEKFEKKIGHKIEIFKETKINNLQNHLFNNIINGIRLYGGIKLK